MQFYTIGYGGRDTKDFLEALVEKGMRSVADVRLRPDPASVGAYTKARSAEQGIEKLLAGAGIKYVSLPELGNLFDGSDYWKYQYRQLLSKAGHLLIDRIYSLDSPFALLCAERDVAHCHRKIIADFLVDQGGFEVEHIP